MGEMRHYKCKFYEVDAPARSCLFCRHRYKVFWDYANGPYAFVCELSEEDGIYEAHFGYREGCKEFEEVG